MDAKEIAAAAGLSSPEEAELLARYLAEEGLTGEEPTSDARVICPQNPEEPLQLSHGQLRLWFLEQLFPGTPVYNLPAAVRLRTPVDVISIERAVNEIARRHSVLRCRFPASKGAPQVVVDPPGQIRISIVDIRPLPKEQQGQLVQTLMQEEAELPFDIGSPLTRFTLLCPEGPEWILLITMHHIVSDGWSVGVFMNEMWRLCEAYASGRPSPLPELPIQYTDFAAWQQSGLDGDAQLKQLEYWREKLRGLSPILDIPADRTRPSTPRFLGARLSVQLPPDLCRAVRHFAATCGVTPFVAALSAFKALLVRYTGVSDIAVGTAVAGRNRKEVEGLIGFFVNTLVLRTDLSGDPTVVEVVRRVCSSTLEAHAHSDVPFELVVRDLGVERHLNHAPLFQVAVIHNEDPFVPGEGPGTPIGRYSVHAGRSRFDMTFIVVESDERLRIDVEYSTELFDASRIRRMLEHYENLLRSFVEQPHTRLSRLRFLSDAERRFVLGIDNSVGSNAASSKATAEREATSRSVFRPVHEMFEAQAARQPEALAAVFPASDGEGAQRLSYGQLNAAADRIAARLQRLGVGPERRVAMLLERTWQMVAGLLGILKAGGAYLVLDPVLPARRVASLLEDAGATILLSHRGLHRALPLHSTRVLDWEDEEPGKEGAEECEPPANREGTVAPLQTAYLLYTSGSTGRPKGVAVAHEALANVIEATGNEVGVGVGDRFLGLLSLGFDMATLELLLPLATGGSLVLAPEPLRRDVGWLGRAIEIYGVTVVQATPAWWRMLLSGGWAGRAGLKMISGGEPLSEELAEALLQRGERLWNGYGPTEATIYATFEPVRREGPVTIGRPLRGIRAYVLDRGLELVPVGVTGQLYLGGVGLARGYHGQPGLTADRFLPDPYARQPGGRLYATGDLARLRADGRLEYLGRIDDQVKIRGYRIEPAEVEAEIERYPGVHRCAVVARRSGGEDSRLEAFLEHKDGNPSDPGALRTFLEQRLPSYMIPSVFHTVERIPLSSSGKLDRRALLELQTEALRETTVRLPRTPDEEKLARIWCELLGVTDISIDDNFFLVGGHSLLAVQLLIRIQEKFGVQLPLRRMMESPTVEALAAEVNRFRQARADGKIPPIVRRQGNLPIPLSPGQEHFWRFYTAMPETPFFNLTNAVMIDEGIEPEALQGCIDEIVARHEILRTTFGEVTTGDGEAVAVQQPSENVRVPVGAIDLSELTQDLQLEAAMRLACEERLSPIDLRRGPVLRVKILHLGPQQSMFLLSLHHIVADAWSVGVFARELEALYRIAMGEPGGSLPPLPFQYADFALWQRARRTDLFQVQSTYWLQKLHSLRPFTLPPDLPRTGSEFSFESERLERWIDAPRLAGITRLSGVGSTTKFVTLLAAFKASLAERTGDYDVRVATLVANRERPGTDLLIGLFINTLILRTDLSGEPTVSEVIRRVRATVLDALSNQDVPFEEINGLLEKDSGLARPELARILFMSRPRLTKLVRSNDFSPESGGQAPPRSPLHDVMAEMGATTFDLIINLEEYADGIRVELQYKSVLYRKASMEGLLNRWEEVLDRWTADLDSVESVKALRQT